MSGFSVEALYVEFIMKMSPQFIQQVVLSRFNQARAEQLVKTAALGQSRFRLKREFIAS